MRTPGQSLERHGQDGAGGLAVRHQGHRVHSAAQWQTPYVETKEQLGSFFLLEAEDMQEAVRLASMHPAANLNEKMGWGIEVRPIEFCRAKTIAMSN
jgi:hypothetical protein